VTIKAGPVVTAIVIALAAALFSACASPQSQPKPQTLTQFPDLDHFAAVDAAAYDVAERADGTTQFKTAAGLYCAMNGSTGMGCSIPFAVPGIDASTSQSGCTWAEPTQVPIVDGDPHPYEFKREDLPCPSEGSYKSLPDSSKIAYVADNITQFTCATGNNDFVACIDNKKHGFVLQKAHSWVF
jgi:hypothetical protein